MPKRYPTEDGRVVVSDSKIPRVIEGEVGSYYLWSYPNGGGGILFIYVYGVGTDEKLAWGEILVWDRKDIELIISGKSGLLITLEITQPDSAKAAARRGGLRPSGRIISSQTAAVQSAAADPAQD